jgi:hypothetical protein
MEAGRLVDFQAAVRRLAKLREAWHGHPEQSLAQHCKVAHQVDACGFPDVPGGAGSISRKEDDGWTDDV